MFFKKQQQNPTKKKVYIACFSFLGWMLAYTIFSFVEYLWLNALIENFELNSRGLSWEQWWTIHYIVLLLVSMIGLAYGFWQGNYWWHAVYDKHK